MHRIRLIPLLFALLACNPQTPANTTKSSGSASSAAGSASTPNKPPASAKTVTHKLKNSVIVYDLDANANGVLARSEELSKLDRNLKELWTSDAADVRRAILAPNGDAFVLRTIKNGVAISRHDAATGREVWRALIEEGSADGQTFAADASGGVIVGGSFRGLTRVTGAKGKAIVLNGDLSDLGKSKPNEPQLFLVRLTPEGDLGKLSALPNGGNFDSLCIDRQGTAHALTSLREQFKGGLPVDGPRGSEANYVVTIDPAGKYVWSQLLDASTNFDTTCTADGATIAVSGTMGAPIRIQRWSATDSAKPLECVVSNLPWNVHSVTVMGSDLLLTGVPIVDEHLGIPSVARIDNRCKAIWTKEIPEGEPAASILGVPFDEHTVLLGYTAAEPASATGFLSTVAMP